MSGSHGGEIRKGRYKPRNDFRDDRVTEGTFVSHAVGKPIIDGSPQRNTSEAALGQQKVGRNDPCPCGSGKKLRSAVGHDLSNRLKNVQGLGPIAAGLSSNMSSTGEQFLTGVFDEQPRFFRNLRSLRDSKRKECNGCSSQAVPSKRRQRLPSNSITAASGAIGLRADILDVCGRRLRCETKATRRSSAAYLAGVLWPYQRVLYHRTAEDQHGPPDGRSLLPLWRRYPTRVRLRYEHRIRSLFRRPNRSNHHEASRGGA
ncbi:MAG: hypothetical protein DMG17_30405 [Acidobacteria bacterium]|nr:MAG: hypothetical protein DMG17_30405 [Acidobacteriota bacterium]